MNDAEKSKLEQELREAAPLIERLGNGPSPLPDHARARLSAALEKKFPLTAQQAIEQQAPVSKANVETAKVEPSWLEVWRWWIGLATATAAIALILVLNRPGLNPNLPPVIRVAMLDSIGTVRGTGEKPMEVLQQKWKEAKAVEFSDTAKLKLWQEDWSIAAKQTLVKVLYDRDSGELRLIIRAQGRSDFERKFTVNGDRSLETVLPNVDAAIQEFLKP